MQIHLKHLPLFPLFKNRFKVPSNSQVCCLAQLVGVYIGNFGSCNHFRCDCFQLVNHSNIAKVLPLSSNVETHLLWSSFPVVAYNTDITNDRTSNFMHQTLFIHNIFVGDKGRKQTHFTFSFLRFTH